MAVRREEKKHLSVKGLLGTVRQYLSKVSLPKKQGAGNSPEIPLVDCLMSALAVFSLKFPSLLQFDENNDEEIIRHNLETMYEVQRAPCDTQMRERLDQVEPGKIRGAFKKVFSALQRGKVLEKFQFINGYYLMLSDGTGYFSSKKVHCENCCTKNHRDGSKTYHHQMLGAVIAHPDHKEVIPLCPEPIANTDGQKKNDCERNASKRLLADIRREHPHLPLVLAEDGLASNAPHLRLCQDLDIRFITVVKPDGNKTLFEWMKGIERDRHEILDTNGNLIQRMEFYNGVPLNDADRTLEVNYVELWEFDSEGNQTYHNTWITDLQVTKENVLLIAKGGRARWKIENETFNTLKNQGYKFEHNYGHGKKHLSTIFGMLMMLAFLIDQTQQLCCGLFQAAWKKCRAKTVLWEKIRNAFQMFKIKSWVALYEAIEQGFVGRATLDTS